MNTETNKSMMTTAHYHLAELNIAQLRSPLTDPSIKEFVDNLQPINVLADHSPGFVWRLQTEEGDATTLRAFEDELTIVNLSVWESLEALRAYVYQSRHTDFVRRKKAWFDKLGSVHFVMWWIPVGHTPTVAEAKAKLAHLAAHGETAEAFTFRRVFAPADVAGVGSARVAGGADYQSGNGLLIASGGRTQTTQADGRLA